MNDARRRALADIVSRAAETLTKAALALRQYGEHEAIAIRLSAAGQEAQRAADDLEKG